MDTYTKDILLSQYEIFKQFRQKRLEVKNSIKQKRSIRLPNVPEDISENIVKFIIRKKGDDSASWADKGDIQSSFTGKIESKCFSSNGPISFSPTPNWSVIYFLDATQLFVNESIVCYKLAIPSDSDYWVNIKVNKKETFKDQQLKKRRPRISWSSLKPQLNEKLEIVFEGNFKDIF